MSNDPLASKAARMAEPATDPKLLELLVCPLTKMPLIYDREAQELISRTAGIAYPIRNGVPLMIEDAARRLTDDDLRKLAHRS